LRHAYDHDVMSTSFGLFPSRAVRHTAKIDCQVVRLRDFRLIADRIEDISSEGMLVSPADPVLTGEEVMVAFRVPGLADWVDAEAVVTRVVHGRRPGEMRRELGLEFVHMNRWSRLLLNSFARRLPPIPPRYRRGVWRTLTPR
jgi:hypothetical protein